MYKQVIIINKELKMSKGKTAAQAAHAALGAFLKAERLVSQAWRREGQKKIVVLGENLATLKKQADLLNIPNFLVIDKGLTELEPGTITALGLGPEKETYIDKISGQLVLLNGS